MTATPTPTPVEGGSWVVGPLTGDGIATIIAAALAAAMVAAGFYFQARLARKAERATNYAGAIQAVHDYLEAPYRVRRRDGSADARMAITNQISDVQSRLAFFETHLSVYAPENVADSYRALVHEARLEAGPQITTAWDEPPTRSDSDVPLGLSLDQSISTGHLRATTGLMRRSLRIWGL